MKQTIKYFLILIGVMIFWNLLIMKPLHIFSLYLHQFGRAAMGLILSYRVGDLVLNFNESGYRIINSRGWGSEFMLANAGYLGSVLFALLILYLKGTYINKYLLGGIALFYASVTIWMVGTSYTMVYATIFLCITLVLYMIQNQKFNNWAIDIIAISSIAFVVYDTFIYTIFYQINKLLNIFDSGNALQRVTDCIRLEQLTGLPAIIWATIWLFISMLLVYFFFRRTEGYR